MSLWTWGKVAYDAYLDSWVDSQQLPRGIPWPDWDDLPLEEKEAWGAAAQAVRDASRA